MKDKSNALRRLLIIHEGIRYKPYKCTAGKLTIGVGRNLDDVGITRKEAMVLLEADIENCLQELYKIFGKGKGIDDTRQIALADMMFNLGSRRFSKFKRFIKAAKERDWEQAAIEMKDSKWYGQVGNRSKRLEKMIRFGDAWHPDF